MLPSCGVVILMMLVNDPLPILVIAATEIQFIHGVGHYRVLILTPLSRG